MLKRITIIALKELFPNADRPCQKSTKVTLTFSTSRYYQSQKDSFSESEDFSEAGSLQIIQGESDTQSASDNFQSLVFHSESSITDDTRSYIVFSTMFMNFELSSGDFV